MRTSDAIATPRLTRERASHLLASIQFVCVLYVRQNVRVRSRVLHVLRTADAEREWCQCQTHQTHAHVQLSHTYSHRYMDTPASQTGSNFHEIEFSSISTALTAVERSSSTCFGVCVSERMHRIEYYTLRLRATHQGLCCAAYALHTFMSACSYDTCTQCPCAVCIRIRYAWYRNNLIPVMNYSRLWIVG